MINVLIVEDDPMVTQINQKYVNSIDGFHVVKAVSNGQEALQSIKNRNIHLIILDIYMPKVDGLSFLKQIRKQHNDIDVIIVSAAKKGEIIDTVLKLGAVDYLVKPFEYERLKKSLENYKTRFNLLKDMDSIQQEEIDKITRVLASQNNQIPKGLQNKTLNRIRELLRNNPNKKMSSADIAKKIDVSRVTVRRYLEYLESIGEIILEIEYGSVGRPTNLYKYSKHLL